jgi:hypothetical protein
MQSARVLLVFFRKEGCNPLFLNASRVDIISGFETPLPVTTSYDQDHNSLTPFSPLSVTKGHEKLIPFIKNTVLCPLSIQLLQDVRSPALR